MIAVVLCLVSFYGGLYVGSAQGVLYALGIEATSAQRRLYDYRRDEAYEGEYEEKAEQTIDQNISYFGEHLRRHYLLHKVPSPWSISDSGMSFMQEVTQFRLENPRRNDERRQDFLDPSKAEEILQTWLGATLDENGKPTMSEEEALEFAEQSLRYERQKERDYQRAIDYVRKGNSGDA